MSNLFKTFKKPTPSKFITVFKDYEPLIRFKCNCSYPNCITTTVHSDILVLLKQFEALYPDNKLVISSAYRCQKHNFIVGGKDESHHLIGAAVDIMLPKGVPMKEFYDRASKVFPFVISYKKFIHCDLRLY